MRRRNRAVPRGKPNPAVSSLVSRHSSNVLALCAGAAPHRPARLLAHPRPHTLSSWLSGLPVVMLTTTGAKTGQQRTTPVITVSDGNDLVVIGSN
jgi:hypothetical protein